MADIATEAFLKDLMERRATLLEPGACRQDLRDVLRNDLLSLVVIVEELQKKVRTLEVVAAWREADLSEGRACKLLGLDRVSLRECWLEAAGNVCRLERERCTASSREEPTTAPA